MDPAPVLQGKIIGVGADRPLGAIVHFNTCAIREAELQNIFADLERTFGPVGSIIPDGIITESAFYRAYLAPVVHQPKYCRFTARSNFRDQAQKGAFLFFMFFVFIHFILQV